jgi:hypothetical protein
MEMRFFWPKEGMMFLPIQFSSSLGSDVSLPVEPATTGSNHGRRGALTHCQKRMLTDLEFRGNADHLRPK